MNNYIFETKVIIATKLKILEPTRELFDKYATFSTETEEIYEDIAKQDITHAKEILLLVEENEECIKDLVNANISYLFNDELVDFCELEKIESEKISYGVIEIFIQNNLEKLSTKTKNWFANAIKNDLLSENTEFINYCVNFDLDTSFKTIKVN
jgi:hypothetical protein